MKVCQGVLLAIVILGASFVYAQQVPITRNFISSHDTFDVVVNKDRFRPNEPITVTVTHRERQRPTARPINRNIRAQAGSTGYRNLTQSQEDDGVYTMTLPAIDTPGVQEVGLWIPGDTFDTVSFDRARFDITENLFSIPVTIDNPCGHCVYDNGDALISLVATPSIVRPDTATTLSWELSNVSNCDLAGDNGDTWDWDIVRTVQNISTSPINKYTIYTMRCMDKDGEQVSESITVQQNPLWEEI